ncbi:hypothetical protein [Echinicola pacifica]|nr:hypothetical protein [Echinicola pacifica]
MQKIGETREMPVVFINDAFSDLEFGGLLSQVTNFRVIYKPFRAKDL